MTMATTRRPQPPISVGGSKTGVFETRSDVDAFSFSAIAGHVYAATCVPSTVAEGCKVRMFDPAGNLVATGSAGADVGFEVTAAGTYRIDVSYEWTWTHSPYALALRDLGPDDHGDTIVTATPIVVGTTVTGAIEAWADVDVFSFNVVAGHAYQASAATAYGPQLRLLDTKGQWLSAGASSAKAGKTEVWYVSAGGNDNGNPRVGPYGFQVYDLGLDDHGDQISDATPAAPRGNVSGVIEYQDDVDFFAMPLPAGSYYLSTSTVSASVLTTSGTLLMGEGPNLWFTIPSAMTVAVRIRCGYWPCAALPYTFSVH